MKHLLIGLATVLCIPAIAQKAFTLSGELSGKSNEYIYLMYSGEGDQRVFDSVMVQEGKFRFEGKIPGVVAATLMMDRNNRNYDNPNRASIYLEPGSMTVKLVYNKFSELKMWGSKTQSEQDELNKQKAELMAKLKPLSDAYIEANYAYIAAMRNANSDQATVARLKEKANEAKDAMGPVQRQIGSVELNFIENHPQSFVSATLLRYKISSLSYTKVEEYYNRLSEEIKQSSIGKEIKKEIDDLKSGSPGAKAFVFESEELRGGRLSLADYKGKYVLVDFWASWCIPCRKGNPHLLELYKKYKDKGFEIIGVSDDDSKLENWRKAVEEDGIGVWKHILRGLKRTADGGFNRSASISDRYGIHTLPTKILIDPQGVIVGRYGGGGENDEAMDKKLREIFGF
ncbi:MAG TPA: TlpA disulfide reductase family protein [Parasegetibacter sp.]